MRGVLGAGLQLHLHGLGWVFIGELNFGVDAAHIRRAAGSQGRQAGADVGLAVLLVLRDGDARELAFNDTQHRATTR